MEEAIKLLILVLKTIIFGQFSLLEKGFLVLVVIIWFLAAVGVVSAVAGFGMALGGKLMGH